MKMITPSESCLNTTQTVPVIAKLIMLFSLSVVLVLVVINSQFCQRHASMSHSGSSVAGDLLLCHAWSKKGMHLPVWIKEGWHITKKDKGKVCISLKAVSCQCRR